MEGAKTLGFKRSARPPNRFAMRASREFTGSFFPSQITVFPCISASPYPQQRKFSMTLAGLLRNATKLSISVPQCANPTGIVAPLHHCRGSETPPFANIPFRAATVMEGSPVTGRNAGSLA
jgi:hypothetical protein